MAGAAFAGPSDVISTRCDEIEIPLDAQHSASRLGNCSDGHGGDLLWYLDRIGKVDGSLDGRYDRGSRGAGSVVYVMDTGVDAAHVEFVTPSGASRVIAGFDAAGSVRIGNSNCASDNKALAPCYNDYGELIAASHGTSVASIVAGRNIGVAPDAQIVSVRVMNEHGLATTRTYMDGLNAIIRHSWSKDAPEFRTAIVNISGWVLERLSNSDPDPVVPFSAVERKMREMIGGVDAEGRPTSAGRRFLFVVAGNNVDGGCGKSGVVDRFPAILGPEVDGLITVGGMTANNESWSGACRGGIEVLAPAQQIFSATITGNDHYRGRKPNLRSGTSFATPIIAGIAARMLAERPDLSPQQLEAWITSTPSRTIDADEMTAHGKVAIVRNIPPVTGATRQASLAK
jgi:subtilisin family serine protease